MKYHVHYTNFLVGRRSGRVFFNHIFIKPERKGDVGLLEHEKAHVRQWYENKILMPLRYLFSDDWRLRYEAEGYAIEMLYKADDYSVEYYLNKYAELLANTYRIGYDFWHCRKVLEEYYDKMIEGELMK